MRIDVHTHIFPPWIVEERELFCQVDPAFKLLYESQRARLATVETLVESMDRYCIDRSVVFGFPWKDSELAARHNDYVLESALRKSPRLIPLGCVSPFSDGGPREAERCLRAGAKGLGELAIYRPCDPDLALARFEPFIECCRAHGGFLMVHANEPVGHSYPGKATLGVEFYYALARLSAGVPLILAHWGGGLGFYELLKKEAEEVLARVYYDTAASPLLYRPAIYRHMAEILGSGKILFGSDFPLLDPGR
jgi:predicted TIM-barrel fold metal-dependent hydrolase